MHGCDQGMESLDDGIKDERVRESGRVAAVLRVEKERRW